MPIITILVNKSLCDSSVPRRFKQATVRPLLIKQNGSDKKNLQKKNYRQLSNLSFSQRLQKGSFRENWAPFEYEQSKG